MRRSVVLLLGGVILGILLFLVILLISPYQLHGSQIEPPQAAPQIKLTDQYGSTYQLNAQQGKIVLLFFGYTNCPDVCPATLSVFHQVQVKLGDLAARTQFVFITVDPQRDTPDRLAHYLPAFSSNMIGLSGSLEALTPVWQAYGVFRQVQDSDLLDGSYSVDHSSRVYLVDLKGNLRLTYSFGVQADDFVQDIRYLLREN